VFWLSYIPFAVIPLVAKATFLVLSLALLASCLYRLRATDSLVVENGSLSIRSFAVFSYRTKLYKADAIKFLGFYPAFQGPRTPFGIAIIANSKMVPLLHIQGQEAADVFDELNRIRWLAPKISRVDHDLLFREKERRPLKAAWSGFVALMSKPLRLPRL
jgi:hypothetical protein